MNRISAVATRDDFAQSLRANLSRAATLRREANNDPHGAEERLNLRRWQSERLVRTHGDLLRTARYREATTFFLEELYGPKDFSARDEEIERILPSLLAILPTSGIETMSLAIELDALSEELDGCMLAQLRRQGATAAITDASYAEAYRGCGRRPARERQLGLIRRTGDALDALSHKPMISTALRLMSGPAKLAGLWELHRFLQSGFHSFKGMNGADEFLSIIIDRERRIMERLFASDPDPFRQS